MRRDAEWLAAMPPWRPIRTRRPTPVNRGPLAFETYFRARFRPLMRFLMICEGANLTEAEDAVAEAMSDAAARWESIDSPDAWVRQAARRSLINGRQRDRRRGRLTRLAERLTRRPVDAGDFDHGLEVVLSRLGALPPAQREVLALTYDDFSPAEIAEMLGKDPQTVRSNLRAARRTLAAVIRAERNTHDDDGEGGSDAGR